MHRLTRPAAAVGAALPFTCDAHVFAQPYTLPVPFSLYAGGSAAALLLSFAVVGLLLRRPDVATLPDAQAGRAEAPAPAHRTPIVGGAIALLLLALTLASGFLGTRNTYQNFNMTFFWVVFVLGVPYVVALAGDFYAARNPWRALVDLVAWSGLAEFRPRLRLPLAAGHLPALLLYVAFIWIELFGNFLPRGLSWALAAYTVINLVGAWLLGADAWFRHGEFFGVMLRLLGRMAPRRGRGPFLGLLDEPVRDVGLVLFILFMLSSTAFDGIHSTYAFASAFWNGLYPFIGPLLPEARQYALSARLYHCWQWTILVVSPLLYLAVFVAFVALARRAAGGPVPPLRELVFRFSAPLVPIAFVYHLAHYFTLLLAQGLQVVKLVSDPFGRGWNLFGTRGLPVEPIMLSPEAIWHTQVAVIVAGHIVGVWLSHVEALRCFGSPARAARSQLPLLVLMMGFTAAGLWILSLPLAR